MERRKIATGTPWDQSGSNRAVKCLSTRGASDDPVAAQVVSPPRHADHGLRHVVDVRLRVDAARNGQPHQIHRCGRLGPVGVKPEHDRADLDASHPGLEVQGVDEGDPGIGGRGDVGQQRPGVDVDRVASRRLDDRHAGADQLLRQVFRRADPVAKVGLLDHLLEPPRDGLEVVAGQAPVGGEALGQDQQVARLLRPGVVVEREEAPDVGEPVLLGRERRPVGQREHLLRDLAGRSVRVPGLTQLDEVGVLGKAAGVEEEAASRGGRTARGSLAGSPATRAARHRSCW